MTALAMRVDTAHPFSDAGDAFVVQPAAAVPEPSGVLLGVLGALGALAVRLRRKRAAG